MMAWPPAPYTVNLPQAATPALSPATGTYSSAQTVTISTTTPSATIYYTTNGSTPTTSSPIYSGPITVAASETIHAIAVAVDNAKAFGKARGRKTRSEEHTAELQPLRHLL